MVQLPLSRLWLLIALSILVAQCRPLEEKKLTRINWDLDNPEVQKLYGWQDAQNLDSLLDYFHHSDPTFRYGAALAFGSFKTEAAIDSLADLVLNDEVMEVRQAAAYALGQIGAEKAEPILLKAFQKNDSLSIADGLNSTILEAVGKCATKAQLKNLSTITTYLRTDTLLLVGQARGIYRFALRNLILPEGTTRMVDFVARTGYPHSVRLIAANYLGRAKGISLDSTAVVLLSKSLAQSTDPNLRMPLALALGKSKTPAAFNALQNRLGIEKDYRVKCNIIRALASFDYAIVEPLLTPLLDNNNLHVANTAAQYFVDKGIPTAANTLWRKARDTTLHWQIQMTLYKAANKWMPSYFEISKGQVNYELKNRLAASTNPYEKAAILDALSQFKWNYRYIKNQFLDNDQTIVRAAAVNALAEIARASDFVTFFGFVGSKRVKKDLADAFEEAIIKRDPAMTAIAAEVLRDSQLNFAENLDSLDFLTTTLNKLALPREFETWKELKKTIDFFADEDNPDSESPEITHPIDWNVYDPDISNKKATIKTSKGNVVLELFLESAPGTVLNFIKLAQNKFFNGKNFHRVIPNFVIQGGCTRGDGYGSLDYTIRSELPPTYFDQAGLVGMASAGNHTECTQFFITHSPTPHLDGNYTIFARVIEGMGVVHQIEQGDIIESITLSNGS